ncbi:DUF4157 domain-containing protein [Nannocystis sp. ILAH1]|uniref:eCIS core domain-containing protein n=1 Tax=unclassified Nannocystis TaxID=2627009 RepID=UPI00226E8C26|nr:MULTISPECIES: DUF4157 domain-containing protein [unclassified Nannocystis]MCY0989305.1 DUF4157 domain-containing protein [Nannocystis sp. ILAH1]MCY1065000.1 DUF4157 domain-containing protein [Nannocystis sp. RBIL2]
MFDRRRAELERQAESVGTSFAHELRRPEENDLDPDRTAAWNSGPIDPERKLPAPVARTLNTVAGGKVGEIRVHADGRADALARRLHSQAVTVGPDIYFARGEFAPRTLEGSRLVSHEMVHVAQQQRAGHYFPQCRLKIGSDEITKIPTYFLKLAAPDPVTRFVVRYMEEANALFEFDSHEEFARAVAERAGIINRFPAVKAALVERESALEAAPDYEDEGGSKRLKSRVSRALYAPFRRPDGTRGVEPARREALETGAVELSEFERRVELMALSLAGQGYSLGFADNRLRNDAELARNTLDQREAEGWYSKGKHVGSFKEILVLLMQERRNQVLSGQLAQDEGFIRELAIYGHGFSTTNKSQTGFQFGENFVTLEFLEQQTTGALGPLFVNGATIDLLGCDAAKGPNGEKFQREIGRVFFGREKRGYIRANTCMTNALIPGSDTAFLPCGPKTLKWTGTLE